MGGCGPVEAIGTDEQRFLDRSRTKAYVIEEHATPGGTRADEILRLPALVQERRVIRRLKPDPGLRAQSG